MKPLLVHSDLTGRYYVATRYTTKKTVDGKAYIVAHTKYDVTADFERLYQARRAAETGEAPQ